MKIKPFLGGVLCLALTATSMRSHAQEKEDPTEKREITIGSHILKQQGESEHSYKNGEYYYEKVWEASSASKEELYKRVKKWMDNLSEIRVSDVTLDPEDKSQIGFTLEMNIKEGLYMDHETARFHWTFSFKEGKVRLQGSNFRYYGDYDRGMESRQLATANGLITRYEQNAQNYDMPLHNLKPLTKRNMRRIYENFDVLYSKLVQSMNKDVLTDSKNDW